jgi:hypothetical protein
VLVYRDNAATTRVVALTVDACGVAGGVRDVGRREDEHAMTIDIDKLAEQDLEAARRAPGSVAENRSGSID